MLPGWVVNPSTPPAARPACWLDRLCRNVLTNLWHKQRAQRKVVVPKWPLAGVPVKQELWATWLAEADCTEDERAAAADAQADLDNLKADQEKQVPKELLPVRVKPRKVKRARAGAWAADSDSDD